MLQENFVKYIEDSLKKNWELPALADYNGESYKYSDIAVQITRLHEFLRLAGVSQQDKVALVGKNSARWCITYLAIVTYGAVIVPILPDFKPEDLHGILNHSDAMMLFADEIFAKDLRPEQLPSVKGIFSVFDYAMIHSGNDQIKAAYEQSSVLKPVSESSLTADKLAFDPVPNDRLAAISYTSGTAGFVKGVMLQHNSLAANIKYAQHNMPLQPGDKIVSFLPLAHAFGAAFEFLFPFTLGCSITILTKTPSPQIALQAFQEVRPALVLSVPLVIEKIFKKQIQPVISKWYMKVLLLIPGVRGKIHTKIREKLVSAFGGQFHEIVIGGAPFNKQVERFFHKIKFPFTVGYGMTECGPLICYQNWRETRIGASGKVVDTLELKIDSPDPRNIPGEISVKGDNVMLGYYKNPELTAEIIDANGWLHTGDLGLVDAEGRIYLKGRSKSMILGPNGKNIYPDEIENRLNNRHGIGESLIVSRNNKLIALLYPDQDVVAHEKLAREDLEKLFEHHRKAVNKQVPHFISIAGFEIQDKEFAKTPKRSIKRFLYS
ncbi:MAG TPA: AMP-binding protein [Bacteroidales bacterium]|nr:AMP-binding protein [Bacteroidales bacterium]HPT01540.1 AMP-binding protein [Bacteroidales bacterium]